jgi:hypothetical protein
MFIDFKAPGSGPLRGQSCASLFFPFDSEDHEPLNLRGPVELSGIVF